MKIERNNISFSLSTDGKNTKPLKYAVDRYVVGACNTRVSNRGVSKGCEEIDSSHHFHLQDLINILDIFAEWKLEAKKKANFIPYQSYEDLIHLITTNIDVANIYLKENKSRTIVQRRGGSGNCEHEFEVIRERNTKPFAMMFSKVFHDARALKLQRLTL